MRIVFDSNVYLAAAKSKSYALVQLKRGQPNGPYQLFISPEIILEVRSKLEEKFNWAPRESAEFIETILCYAKLVHPREKVQNVLGDADDHKILECALEAGAELIITADRELLKLKEFRTVKIAHPAMLKYLF